MAQVEELREFITFGGAQVSLDGHGQPLESLHETQPRKRVYKPRHKRLCREQFLTELTGGRRTVSSGKPTETLSRQDFLQELKNG